MNIVNLTPHPVSVCQTDGTIRTIMPSEQPARIASQTEPDESDGKVKLYRRVGEFPVGVPEPVEGTIFIVSSVVKMWFREGRDDLVVPAYYDKALGACRGFWR